MPNKNDNLGDRHALDNLRGVAGPMVTWIGEFVYTGRFYSHFAGTRAGSSGNQPGKRTKNRPLVMNEGIA